MADEKKIEVKKEELTKEELTTLIQVLNQPRQMDLQVATSLIQLNNKLSRLVDGK